MNEIEKIINQKKTENGDTSYKSTGNNLADLFFLTSYFEKHLDEVKIGNTEKEKLFSMFIRDPRFGLGRRDLGRTLMMYSGVSSEDIVLAGRYDDLWHIPTKNNLEYLKEKVINGDELAKKWLPRLTSGKKTRLFARALCKEWNLTQEEYRKLIKTDKTVEYKLSYAEKSEDNTELNNLFGKINYTHPLVDKIDFEKVPSLAMQKYLNTFLTREDLKNRFGEYIKAVKENKAKVNVSTATVHDAYKTVNRNLSEASDIIGKKIVESATLGVELNAIPILDTSGSMYSSWRTVDYSNVNDIGVKATSVAHAIATHSTFSKNQLISFSSNPQLMTIKGDTLEEQYKSMYTGDCSNTDFKKVMELLSKLKKFPEYLVVLSDMEFDIGSIQSKETTMKIFKEYGANTKIIWWNFNDRNKTVPEFDEHGNIYLSGYNLQILKLIENGFDMTEYIDKVIEDYRKKIGK